MKKSFFREPTPTQIQRRKKIEVSPRELDQALDQIQKTDSYLLVRGILVPEHYRSHRKFIKHGPEIPARHPKTMSETKDKAQYPYQAKREMLKRAEPHVDYAGWAFYPLAPDRRKRRVLFTSCFDAARIYAYAHQSGIKIQVKPYHEARKAKREGAEVFVEVPSRTKGRETYKFKFMSSPVVDAPDKFVVAHNIGTNHRCHDIDYMTRYRFEDQAETSQVVNLCGHVGAGWLGVIDHFWTQEKNRVPLRCGQFDIPTIPALEFYKTLLGRVLLQETPDKKPRRPDRAERNIAISDRLKREGYNWMFFPTKTIQNQVDIRDYDWKIE